MKTTIKTIGPTDSPTYLLEREDGETLKTRDLVLIRTTVQQWSEMEYQPRTAREALAQLGAAVESLRPAKKPKKEQIRNAHRVVRGINKLLREKKLRTDL